MAEQYVKVYIFAVKGIEEDAQRFNSLNEVISFIEESFHEYDYEHLALFCYTLPIQESWKVLHWYTRAQYQDTTDLINFICIIEELPLEQIMKRVLTHQKDNS